MIIRDLMFHLKNGRIAGHTRFLTTFKEWQDRRLERGERRKMIGTHLICRWENGRIADWKRGRRMINKHLIFHWRKGRIAPWKTGRR